VHRHGLADDEAICDELADGLAGVGVGDLADLIGIEPDLALSAADDGGRQARERVLKEAMDAKRAKTKAARERKQERVIAKRAAQFGDEEETETK